MPTTLAGATTTELVEELTARLTYPRQAATVSYRMLKALATQVLLELAGRLPKN